LKLLELLQNEAMKSKRLILMILVSGVCNAMLLVLINKASEKIDGDRSFIFLASILAVMLFLLAQRYILRQGTKKIQNVIEDIRIKIIDELRFAELSAVEALGNSEIYARMSDDTQRIAEASLDLIKALQAMVLVLFSFIYIGTISLPALVILLLGIVIGGVFFFYNNKSAATVFKEVARKDTAFYQALSDMLHGFKELKINRQKSDDANIHYRMAASEVNTFRVKARFINITSQLATESLFFLVLIGVVFVIPQLQEYSDPNIVKISAAILFLIGPVTLVIGSIPSILEASQSAENIENLERSIRSAKSNTDQYHVGKDNPLDLQHEIALGNLYFEYPSSESNGFKVGPFSVTIPKGKITFIVGGNGSGKSTLLKLISGLYYPDSGIITKDGVPISPDNYQHYREMFSVIFADFHLFERLFGLGLIDEQKVEILLSKLKIDHKTKFKSNAFSEIKLSTGQRKRLALITALLEDKQAYVFDEVAADQDPIFKKFFYEELLFELRALGKTLIVVTHDENYFHLADRQYKLQDGQLISND